MLSQRAIEERPWHFSSDDQLVEIVALALELDVPLRAALDGREEPDALAARIASDSSLAESIDARREALRTGRELVRAGFKAVVPSVIQRVNDIVNIEAEVPASHDPDISSVEDREPGSRHESSVQR